MDPERAAEHRQRMQRRQAVSTRTPTRPTTPARLGADRPNRPRPSGSRAAAASKDPAPASTPRLRSIPLASAPVASSVAPAVVFVTPSAVASNALASPAAKGWQPGSGTIAAIISGGVVAVGILGMIVFFAIRRCRRRKSEKQWSVFPARSQLTRAGGIFRPARSCRMAARAVCRPARRPRTRPRSWASQTRTCPATRSSMRSPLSPGPTAGSSAPSRTPARRRAPTGPSRRSTWLTCRQCPARRPTGHRLGRRRVRLGRPCRSRRAIAARTRSWCVDRATELADSAGLHRCLRQLWRRCGAGDAGQCAGSDRPGHVGAATFPRARVASVRRRRRSRCGRRAAQPFAGPVARIPSAARPRGDP